MLQGTEEQSLPIKLTNRKPSELKRKYLFIILFIKHHPYREAAARFFHFQSLRRAAVDILSIFIGSFKACFFARVQNESSDIDHKAAHCSFAAL